MLSSIRSMARAFVLACLFYEPNANVLREIFNHADLNSIGIDEYIVIEYKRVKLSGIDKLFQIVEVEESTPVKGV